MSGPPANQPPNGSPRSINTSHGQQQRPVVPVAPPSQPYGAPATPPSPRTATPGAYRQPVASPGNAHNNPLAGVGVDQQDNTRGYNTPQQGFSLGAPGTQSGHRYPLRRQASTAGLAQINPGTRPSQPSIQPQQRQQSYPYSTGYNMVAPSFAVGAQQGQQWTGFPQQQGVYQGRQQASSGYTQGQPGNNQPSATPGYMVQYQGYTGYNQGQQGVTQRAPMNQHPAYPPVMQRPPSANSWTASPSTNNSWHDAYRGHATSIAGQGSHLQGQQQTPQLRHQANVYGNGTLSASQQRLYPSGTGQQHPTHQSGPAAASVGYGGMPAGGMRVVPPPLPPTFNSDGIPTPYGIATWIHGSATDADSRVARFPLRITPQGPFIAPLPFVTEQERRLQQTTRDVHALGQLYMVEPVVHIAPGRLPFGEGQEVLTARIELGRFSQPHWQTYPANTTFPARRNQHGGAPLAQQPWLPPHAMPRHPAMAYWGRDLSNQDHQLPTMRAYVAGQVEQRELFVRAADGDTTDRGWGPGVQVHGDVREGLERATAHMQQLVINRDAAQWAAGEGKQKQQREQ